MPNNIKALRIAQGLTQASLAKKTGLSLSSIALLEQRPERGMTVKTLTLLARALGTTLEAILPQPELPLLALALGTTPEAILPQPESPK